MPANSCCCRNKVDVSDKSGASRIKCSKSDNLSFARNFFCTISSFQSYEVVTATTTCAASPLHLGAGRAENMAASRASVGPHLNLSRCRAATAKALKFRCGVSGLEKRPSHRLSGRQAAPVLMIVRRIQWQICAHDLELRCCCAWLQCRVLWP
jgi:hypothetical protein